MKSEEQITLNTVGTGTIRWAIDEELSAMNAIVEALEPLDADARSRALRWVCARYMKGRMHELDT